MENIGIYNLVEALKLLNPEVQIDFYDRTKSPVEIIFGTVPGENLVFPDGYYYNDKNGITNKHNTGSGIYESFTYEYVPAHFEKKRTAVANSSPKKRGVWARLFG